MFPCNKRLVYLIDDDDAVRESTVSLLKSASIEVVGARVRPCVP